MGRFFDEDIFDEDIFDEDIFDEDIFDEDIFDEDIFVPSDNTHKHKITPRLEELVFIMPATQSAPSSNRKCAHCSKETEVS